MTRIGETEGLDDDDSLESVLDEIPDPVAWMNSYDYDSLEPVWMNEVVVQEGGGGRSRVLYDDSGLYSFPPTGNQFSTQFGRGGNRSQMFVGGGGGRNLSPKSVSMAQGFGGMYEGDGMNRSRDLSTDEELCRYLNRMGVRDDEYVNEVKYRDVDFIGFRLPDDPYGLNDRVASLPNSAFGFWDFRNECGGYGGGADGVAQEGYLSYGRVLGGMMSPASSGFPKEHISDNLTQYQMNPRRSGPSYPHPLLGNSTLSVGEQAAYTHCQKVSQSNFSNALNVVFRPDSLYYMPKTRMDFIRGDGILKAPDLQQVRMHQRPMLNTPSNSGMPQGGFQDINHEGSFILQGQGMNPVSNKNVDSLQRHLRGSRNGTGGVMPKGKHTHQIRSSKIHGSCENQHVCSPGGITCKLGALSAICGQLPDVAKHQTQCRMLQDIIEQRIPQATQAIFDKIIKHVVELMVNPFGNYFMQKLLDVCSEEQRTKIIDVAAMEPGVLVQVAMNDHGTRVIQKLIETAKTKEQILKIISALEPEFYALITDANGNHVIERCLHCFTNEQNEFIFVAAIEYCIDVATDQYGCCVLQKCIGYSNGKYRDCLVAKISNNAILLSQDAFGNYAVQFILDMKNPTYTSRLISELRGNYVHLAMQKCSSHVVEKCLKVFNSRNKSQLIHELLSFNHFEQLLQDPHANYVIQTAVKVSEGSVRQRLIQEIKLCRPILPPSPYSKRIFASMNKK